MWNAESKMQNGMGGATVIGRDVTPRDRSHSAFHRTPCVECMEVLRKVLIVQISAYKLAKYHIRIKFKSLAAILTLLGDVGLRIGPTRGLSVDGNISPQRRKKEERL